MQLQKNQQIIEQIIFLPERTQEEHRREFQLFTDNFDLIWRNADIIINTPEFYYSYFHCAFISAMFMGNYYLRIGQLLHLWKQNTLVDTCDKCQGPLYIFCAGGSPLSGRNRCSGICGDCKKFSSISLPGCRRVMEALHFIKTNQNKRKVIRTKGQSFSWGEGLVGEAVPDEVIEEGIQPATFTDVVARLKQCEAGEK